jgi:geranylgeranyl reductase family protein
MHDIIISGAGPSGSQCAENLAKAGYKIALIERDTNWRKPCGGGIHNMVTNLYPSLKKISVPKIRKMITYSADFHFIEFDLNLPGIVMDRLEFDNFIRNSAVNAGAELFDKNISYDFIVKNKKRIGIKTKTSSGIKEYYGKIIIIADGMSSKLALKSGLRKKWKSEESGVAKCAIMEGNSQLDEETIYVYFKPYMGFGWIFPLGNNRFNIGCGTFYEDTLNYNLNHIYNDFLKEPKVKEYLTSSNYKVIWSGAYSLPGTGVLEKSLYADNLMLIGDAAGFTSPINGEGIPSSLVSGKIAAEIALNALKEEDYSINFLKRFKTNPEIKNYIRNFKLRYSVSSFFYENQGENLNKMLQLAKEDPEFKNQVRDLFLSSTEAIPPKDFFSRIRNAFPYQV